MPGLGMTIIRSCFDAGPHFRQDPGPIFIKMPGMPQLNISKDFLLHFRENPVEYKLSIGRRYRSLKYRQYKGRHNLAQTLYPELSGITNDNEILLRLTNHLQEEELPRALYLRNFVQQFIKRLNSLRTNRAHHSSPEGILPHQLSDFAFTIDRFLDKMQKRVLLILRTYMAEKNQVGPEQIICSEDIGHFHKLMDHYFELLKEWYDHFNKFLQIESHDENAIIITTETGKYLLRLTEFIERSFPGVFETLYLLEKWKERMQEREMQEVYN